MDNFQELQLPVVRYSLEPQYGFIVKRHKIQNITCLTDFENPHEAIFAYKILPAIENIKVCKFTDKIENNKIEEFVI